MVAASGGPDSCALAIIAAQSGRAVLGHVNHHLQADTHRFEEVVAELGQLLQIPVRVAHVDGDRIIAGRLGLEAEARMARYRALADLWNGPILTAHTAHDRLDTVLMRLVQGTGLGALDGPRYEVEIGGRKIIRPMLDWFEEDVAELLAATGVSPAIDTSNLDQQRLRNAVRPIGRQLAALVPPEPLARSLRNLAADAARLRRADEALFGRISREYDDEFMLRISDLVEAESGDAIRLLTIALGRLGVRSTAEFAFRIQHLQAGQRARGSGVVAEHCGSILRLAKCSQERLPVRQVNVDVGPVTETPVGTLTEISATAEHDRFRAGFDRDQVQGVLHVRSLSPTDRFVPHGKTSEVGVFRRLSKDGWPETRRRTALALADDLGVLWVLGGRRGSRALVMEGSRRVSFQWKPW